MDDQETSADDERGPWGRRVRSVRFWLLSLLALLLLAQLVPYGRSHDNPPVKTEPKWTSSGVRKLAMDACGDCHSNVTTWPAYSNIAPGSWLIQRDVEEGRTRLNWSEGCGEADEISEVIKGGGMPPLQYKILHPAARLSKSERDRLATGLAESIRASGNFHECGGGG